MDSPWLSQLPYADSETGEQLAEDDIGKCLECSSLVRTMEETRQFDGRQID